MPFDANTPVKVLDLLTVITMLEHCEPSMTRVSVLASRGILLGPWANVATIQGSRSPRPPLSPMTTCMECLLKLFTVSRDPTMGKAALLQSCKEGHLHVTDIQLIDDDFHCLRCSRSWVEVNNQWQNFHNER